MSLSDRERAGAFWAFVTTVLAVAFTVLTTHSERAGAFWAFFATILAVAVRLRSERTGVSKRSSTWFRWRESQRPRES
ncbi:hypothetical protein [Halorussus caseinilyticus]|uniref:hypothetical protein n=1 Tax=Halorussus caseinilyticus TaxID=3034025 RepID=UPI0023E85EAA|nr:hypothetical protein [Halorussus sp. DT72]